MAKSKAGGTRSYLRGRIASDVYSIGKDGKGKKQQVVRGLAESVANPRTEAQMRQRMVMTTVSEVSKALRGIIDHSFDGIPAGQPSISHFVTINAALLRADAIAHPSDSENYIFNSYGETDPKGGAFIVSEGKAVLPSNLDTSEVSGNILFSGYNEGLTFGQFKQSLGMGYEDYITFIYAKYNVGYKYVRIRLKKSVDDSTVLTADSFSSIWDIENPFGLNIEGGTNNSYIFLRVDSTDILTSGVILSRKMAGKYIHSSCKLNAYVYGYNYSAEDALATYPKGSSKFLNGGDI